MFPSFLSRKITHGIPSVTLLVSRCNVSTDASPKPFNSIPGPKPIPFLGNVKELREIIKGEVGEDTYVYSRLAKQYGDIFRLRTISSSRSLVVVSNADLINEIFKNEGKYPVRSTYSESNVLKWIHDKNNMPTGLLMAYKNDWKRLRSSMTKQVTPRRLEHFTPALSAVADDLCNHIEAMRDDNGWMGDIYYPLQMWAMKGITKIAFNELIDTFSKGNKQVDDFVNAVQSFMASLGKITLVPPLYKIYPTKSYKQYVTSFNKIRSIGKELLNNHYEQLLADHDIEAGTVDEDSAVGLLDQWLIEGKLSEDEAVVQACDMLFAGVDTTSSGATFMLHEIAKNPEVQNAVVEEIMEVVGPHDSPTPKHLQKLSLVRKCVKEALRIHPVLLAYPREVEKDCVLMGYQIPAGTICIFNFHSLSRDSRYFKDPLKFNPERWSRETEDIHPYASLPFGFGPRSCYGRRIAELELHLLLTRVLQRFELVTNQKTMNLIVEATLKPTESVGIKFADRQLK